VKWAEFIAEDQMQRERQAFRTTADHCACGETVLRSTFYRIHNPCHDQINIRVAQPKLSDEIRVATRERMVSLDFRIRIREGEEEAEESRQAEWLRKYAMRTIKRFSQMKEEEELATFISVNFAIDGRAFWEFQFRSSSLPVSRLTSRRCGRRKQSKTIILVAFYQRTLMKIIETTQI
jgi:hypothetical protein